MMVERAQRAARPPLKVPARALPIARVLWIALILFGAFVFVATLPIYYRHTLELKSSDSWIVHNPAEWRTGLHALGLTPRTYALYNAGTEVLLAVTMLLVGLIIFLRKSDEWIGLFVSLVLASFGLAISNTNPVGFPDWVTNLAAAYINMGYLSFFVIPLVFPDGRFVPRWSGWVVAILLLLSLGPSVAPHTSLDSNTWPGAINGVLALVVVATMLFSPIYRYVCVSDRVQREQTKWAIFVVLLAIVLFLLAGTVVPAIPGVTAHPVQAVLIDFGTKLVAGIGFLLVPVGFGIAILRYRLWDIDVLINRTLVYGSLTLTLVGLYIGGVVALQALFRAVTGQHSELVVAIVTLAVAAIFNPWRRRVQSFIDHRFYRRKYDAGRILAGFSAALRDEVDLDHLTHNLLSVAHETVQPESVALWLREREGTA